jgi:hypothetical protein
MRLRYVSQGAPHSIGKGRWWSGASGDPAARTLRHSDILEITEPMENTQMKLKLQ